MRTSLILAVLLSLVHPGSARAQSQITTGVIDGMATDATGAALPGVTIEARNVDTNFTRTSVSAADGRFALLQLPPGHYKVTFTLSGFATLSQENLELTVGQTVTLGASMKVSGVSETVTVTQPPVEVTRTASASTLNQTAVENTPILGRKFEDLLTLTPGVSIVQGADGDEISFAGQRGIFNNISLDGGDYNNGFFGEQAGGQRAAIDITLEAVREFQVIATGAPAEFGRTAGGVVNVVTKSGTNQTHGTLFHFQRVEALTGDLSDGTTLDNFHREQFGGTIGGPIKKDKTFFFLALEGITGNFERPNLSRQLGDTACPVQAPTLGANEALINGNSDCQRLALLNFFSVRLGQQEGTPIRTPCEERRRARQDRRDAQPEEQPVGLVELQSLPQRERDLRRAHVRHVGERHRGRSGEDQRRQRELVHDAFVDTPQRGAFHVLAGEPSEDGGALEPGRGHRRRVRSLVSLRQSVLLAAERRRADLAHANQGQPHAGARRPHAEGGRRVDAHAERSGLPGVLYGSISV